MALPPSAQLVVVRPATVFRCPLPQQVSTPYQGQTQTAVKGNTQMLFVRSPFSQQVDKNKCTVNLVIVPPLPKKKATSHHLFLEFPSLNQKVVISRTPRDMNSIRLHGPLVQWHYRAVRGPPNWCPISTPYPNDYAHPTQGGPETNVRGHTQMSFVRSPHFTSASWPSQMHNPGCNRPPSAAYKSQQKRKHYLFLEVHLLGEKL